MQTNYRAGFILITREFIIIRNSNIKNDYAKKESNGNLESFKVFEEIK